VDHLAVAHRVLDDAHGSTVMVSVPLTIAVRGRGGVGASAQISLRVSALAFPGSRHGSETPKTYGEAMTDADSSTELGA